MRSAGKTLWRKRIVVRSNQLYLDPIMPLYSVRASP
jgi:hypothetical protein